MNGLTDFVFHFLFLLSLFLFFLLASEIELRVLLFLVLDLLLGGVLIHPVLWILGTNIVIPFTAFQ